MTTEMTTPEITAKDGVLYRGNVEIDCPEADLLAKARGFDCAEQLVKHLTVIETALMVISNERIITALTVPDGTEAEDQLPAVPQSPSPTVFSK